MYADRTDPEQRNNQKIVKRPHRKCGKQKSFRLSIHRLVSSMPFRFPFHLPVPFLNGYFSWVSILKPCWPIIFKSFQQHFSIISKFVCCGFYIKKDVGFTLISFALLKWDECLSVQLPFELPVEIPVQLHLELEVNWLVQNVNELEFELSRI